METGTLISKISAAVPGAYLHKSRFGRSDLTSIWVDLRKIREVSAFLRDDSATRLAWLENMSVAQVEDSLVVTYFLRRAEENTQKEKALPVVILRGSVHLDTGSSVDARVDIRSVTSVWENAVPMEQEFAELFGIRFLNDQGVEERSEKPLFLPQKWAGFPLRKNYVFPQEVFGIEHSRSSPVKASDGGFGEVKKNAQ